jgi:hypothetical protein
MQKALFAQPTQSPRTVWVGQHPLQQNMLLKFAIRGYVPVILTKVEALDSM